MILFIFLAFTTFSFLIWWFEEHEHVSLDDEVRGFSFSARNLIIWGVSLLLRFFSLCNFPDTEWLLGFQDLLYLQMNPDPLSLIKSLKIHFYFLMHLTHISKKLYLIRPNPHFQMIMLIYTDKFKIKFDLKFFLNKNLKNIL